MNANFDWQDGDDGFRHADACPTCGRPASKLADGLWTCPERHSFNVPDRLSERPDGSDRSWQKGTP